MAAKSSILTIADRVRSFSSIRRGFKAGIIVFNKQPKSSKSSSPQSPPSTSAALNVPGLSSQVLNVPNEPVGPGAAKAAEYKNPEYYCYDKTSYFQAEIEILKYRCPQPSSKGPVQK